MSRCAHVHVAEQLAGPRACGLRLGARGHAWFAARGGGSMKIGVMAARFLETLPSGGSGIGDRLWIAA
jgi:hypothetical protein